MSLLWILLLSSLICYNIVVVFELRPPMLNRSVSNRVLFALDLSIMAFSLNKCRCIKRNTHSMRVTVISVVNLGCKLLSWQDSKIVLVQEYFVAFPDILWEVTHHNLIAEWVRDQEHAHLFFYCLSFRFSNAVFILDKWIVKEILNLFTRNERNVVLSHARSLPHFFCISPDFLNIKPF